MVAFLPPAVASLLLLFSSGNPNAVPPPSSNPNGPSAPSSAPTSSPAQGRPTDSNGFTTNPPAVQGGGGGGGRNTADLIRAAKSRIEARDPDGAFANLADAYGIDPTAGGLQALFESCLRLRIDVAEEEEQQRVQQLQENEGREVDGTGTKPRSAAAAPPPAATAAVQDRFGLASLLIDQERYEEASSQLRTVVSALRSSSAASSSGNPDSTAADSSALLDKASAMLYRTNAACCHWDEYDADGAAVAASLDRFSGRGVPALHPFEALKFPCVTLERATEVAAAYARRAEANAGVEVRSWVGAGIGGSSLSSLARPSFVSARTDEILRLNHPNRIIRVGYLSPDFTSSHPLAFLMQHVFRNHDRDRFRVNVYSLSRDDGSPEVAAVRDGSDAFTVLPPGMTARDMAQRIAEDGLDVMVDLCGYVGSSVVAEVMATRLCAPVQVSYMGFPGSSGASYVDYMVVDPTVVPPSVEKLRGHYTERLVLMPDCYFVNSHRTCAREYLMDDLAALKQKRRQYGLPEDGFVYCCHSRPDKIDPCTFRTWLGALVRVREKHDPTAVLWLLRSGGEMERNLCDIAREEFNLEQSALVFCDIAPRGEHLRRLACADLFLDTIAYGAHTVGCDTLFAGVPMVSLLRPDDDAYGLVAMTNSFGKGSSVETDKLASRVGASLLKAAGLEDFICRDMGAYERLMVKCAENKDWYSEVRHRLREMRDTCPLFDTERWVKNLELALRQIVLGELDGAALAKRRDMIVLDTK